MVFVVPFALTFAISFGALTVAKVFKHEVNGKEVPMNNVNFLIAAAIAILAISSPSYARMIYEWAPILATLFIVVFVLVFLKNMFSKEAKGDWTTLIAIAILFLLLMQIGPNLPLPSGTNIKSDDIVLVAGIMLVIAILAIGKKVSEGGTPPKG
jgi:phosphoglycerol transferase MdoB-like AlkP superfamily enzyme